jgi:hypothetical protein
MAAEVEPGFDDEVDETFDVALTLPGESRHNTIVLGGTDLTIPLEMDADGDPFQDDAVCLRSASGFYEQALLSSDEVVRADSDKRYLYYPFEDVPSGVYSVDVQIAGRWTAVISGILVSRGEARRGDEVLGEDPPGDGSAADEAGEDDDEPEAPELGEDGDEGPCDC